ncbi:MAG TPA: hypothetical protein PLB91_01205 [Spirochaetales bacterium]|nr:hypothetical protein [Spirochaetales bacterium]HRY54304.1 hypothetical protein [Spirochaetia bacterium]
MGITDFDDLLDPRHPAAVTEQLSIAYTAKGSPITASEVADRLAPALYTQLADGDVASVVRAAERATIHIGTIAARLGRPLDLDDTVMREIVLDMTIYELHMKLGHEEAGREYRIKAKDLIVAAFGDYPEAGSAQEGKPPVAAVKKAHRRPYP